MREDTYPVVSEGQLSFQVPCQCLRVVAQLVTQRDAVKSRGGFAGGQGCACLRTGSRKQDHSGDSNPALLIRCISPAGLSGSELLQDPYRATTSYRPWAPLGGPVRNTPVAHPSGESCTGLGH